MASSAVRSEIGARLEKFAVERFGNLAGLARAMGIGKSQLGHYLSGKFGIPMKQMERLAELGLNVDWLVYGRGLMDAPAGPLREVSPAGLIEMMRKALNELEEKTTKEDAPNAQRNPT